MDSNALDTNLFHCGPFQWTGMDTIGMDIYPLVAGDADTVVDVVTWHHRTLPLGQREGNPPPGPCFTARGGQANDG